MEGCGKSSSWYPKMKAHPRNNTTNRFPRFKEALNGNFKDKVILDFGGSRGNLLYFSNGEIQPENYISIDPVMEGIEMGREEFPDAFKTTSNAKVRIGKD